MIKPDSAIDHFFATLPIFRGLSASQIECARAILSAKSVDAGHVLMEENQPGETVYIVARGSVKVCARDGNGEIFIGLCGPSEVLGEMSVLDGAKRSATVVAQEPSELFEMSGSNFWSVLWEMPPIPRNCARLLSQRVRVLTSQVQALASLDVQGRLARQLVTLADEYGHPVLAPNNAHAVLIPFLLKQADLGAMIGATREQVNKLLSAWTRRGFIARDGMRIMVCNRAALRKFYLPPVSL